MGIFLIGVDCATEPKKTGLARAKFDGGNCCLLDVKMGSTDVAGQLCEWISDDSPTLLALDAPLGWPDGFGSKLASHKAGQTIKRTCREVFFDRETDRVVRKESGQKPLSVGADRIARTSFVALEILEKVRQNQKSKGQDISIAWTPEIQGVQAIEVYPAATLKMYEYPNKGYKKQGNIDQRKIREEITNKLCKHFKPRIKQSLQDRMLDDPDALDAVVCILAALDFLVGDAIGPENGRERKRAEKEGWIWFRRELFERASSPETRA